MATDPALLEKLNKILALTNSPVEGEAQAATAMLAKLLQKHNLEMHDLEMSGRAAAPSLQHTAHDLGNAAFAWKLDLAEGMADSFFCLALVNRKEKTVAFVGRPDNADTLNRVYAWIIDQIKRLAREARREHLATTGEHIDPLRWQLQFGLGAVQRLLERMQELSEHRSAQTTALVIHHTEELSDWLEANGMPRRDGKRTKEQQASYERMMAYKAEKDAARAEAEANGTMEAFYTRYPFERPLTEEQLAAYARENEEWTKKLLKNSKRRKAATAPRNKPTDWDRYYQEQAARSAGTKAAEKVAIEPFIEGPDA